MNKRQKKKYVLENRIRILETHIDFLVNQNNQVWNVIERNAQVTNARFDKIEKQVADKVSKKPWFSRK